jgi:hypothetical protein
MTGKRHLQDENGRESQNFKGNVRLRSAAIVNKFGELYSQSRGSTGRSRT